MNTAELKKLAEAATQGDTEATGNGVHMRARCVLTTHMEPPEQRQADACYYAAANPAAILELLAINAELVEALKLAKSAFAYDDLPLNRQNVDSWDHVRSKAISAIDAAIARYKGEKK
jgi:hypothetical protein